ncbi:DUF397 domain-containing protein [Streptomyces sp. NPDC020799]|uniref:DUF397 domain-containing protein n=1 Tax=Streptomyces sp. NPDC020799 TaxID=3365091 RepID=UPI0037912CC5
MWFKSSYSDNETGNCVEVAYAWRKSSYSDSSSGNCVEVTSCPHTIHVRDSKLRHGGPQLSIPTHAWADFITYASTDA